MWTLFFFVLGTSQVIFKYIYLFIYEPKCGGLCHLLLFFLLTLDFTWNIKENKCVIFELNKLLVIFKKCLWSSWGFYCCAFKRKIRRRDFILFFPNLKIAFFSTYRFVFMWHRPACFIHELPKALLGLNMYCRTWYKRSRKYRGASVLRDLFISRSIFTPRGAKTRALLWRASNSPFRPAN